MTHKQDVYKKSRKWSTGGLSMYDVNTPLKPHRLCWAGRCTLMLQIFDKTFDIRQPRLCTQLAHALLNQIPIVPSTSSCHKRLLHKSRDYFLKSQALVPSSSITLKSLRVYRRQRPFLPRRQFVHLRQAIKEPFMQTCNVLQFASHQHVVIASRL